MDGAILTFPLRAGLVGTRFVLRTAGSVAVLTLRLGGKATVAATEAAARAAGRLSDEVAWGQSAPTLEASAVETEPETRTPVAEVEPEIPLQEVKPEIPLQEAETEISLPAAEAEISLPEAEPAAVLEPEPPHVSEEPELVEEVAEPGAEDGAGASVEIAEPWPGYRGLRADEVIARIDAATPAELAGIELYETAHRNRQTVLDAAQRSLKTKTGRGSPDRRE